MNKHTLWAVVIQNSIAVICWVILAVFFGKWWIALFSILFLSGGVKTQAHMICDGCGRYSPYAKTHAEAIEKELEAGWVRRARQDGKWEDFCPECQAKTQD